MTTSHSKKRRRISILVPTEVKDSIGVAASFSGLSISEFMRRAVLLKANEVLEQQKLEQDLGE